MASANYNGKICVLNVSVCWMTYVGIFLAPLTLMDYYNKIKFENKNLLKYIGYTTSLAM